MPDADHGGIRIGSDTESQKDVRARIAGMVGRPDSLFAPSKPDDLSSHRHRLTIGALGLILPPFLWIMSGCRPTPGLTKNDWGVLNSISAYYYSGAATAFVGVLVALAVFLFTYRGYGNEYRRRDQGAAFIAGCAAIGVAFFPTRPPESVQPPWWTPSTGTIHYTSAIMLFAAFIFFALFLFPISKGDDPLPRDKRTRNFFYRLCGLVMLFCVLWTAIAKATQASIFLPEAIALGFFSLSWLVKGHADRTARVLGTRVLHYGKHPTELAADFRRVFLG